MAVSISKYYYYWGKTKKSTKDENQAYHLLPYHCLDVAAVGQTLLSDSNLCSDVSQILDIPTEQLIALFCYCIALHDLGKFSSSFQALFESDSANLIKASPRFPYNAKEFKHDRLGYYFWHSYITSESALNFSLSNLDRRTQRMFRDTLMVLMNCSLGHHGVPINTEALIEFERYIEEHNLVAATEFIQDIEVLFNPDFNVIATKDKNWLANLKLVSWHLAGIAVLADWIGSDRAYFDYQMTYEPLNEYWEKSLLKAKHVVASLDFDKKYPVVAFQSTQQQFGFSPTPLQSWAEQVQVNESPQLFILEDETGSGKTEAALILTHRLMESGAADGFYFGLPTMATSNAMFDRIAEYYQNIFSSNNTPSIVLAHAAREMNKRFHEFKFNSQIKDINYTPDDITATAQCHQWLTDSRKKALLATVGVGTIDQVLLSVLPRRHQSLRVLGLHRKVLIFDEVHAADEYMFELLESLLSLHLHQGGSVILLSATLPLKQRQRLSNIWQNAVGVSDYKLKKKDFPLATKVTINKEPPLEKPIKPNKKVSRKINIDFIHSEDTCIEKLISATNDGSCAVWIRNSVDDALRAYHKVAMRLKNLDKCILFHSRFTLLDRNRIENQVLKAFGKFSASADRQGTLLIATQVFQESLDADTDMMISDICPIDDLIQRVGRLHRHNRDKFGVYQKDISTFRKTPKILLHSPLWDENPDEDWLKSNFLNTHYVYRSPGRLWLGMKKLKELGSITMPDNARDLIEAVYAEDADNEIPEALKKAEQVYLGENRAKAAKANSQLLKWKEHGYSINSAIAWHDDTTDISTRYSDIEIGQAVLVRIVEGDLFPYAGDVPFSVQKSTVKLNYRKYIQNLLKVDEDDKKTKRFMDRFPAAKYQTLWLFEDDKQFTYSKKYGFVEKQILEQQ